MNSMKIAAWAFLAIVATELPAQAAWNNVFQPTLFGRLNRSTSNYCCPAPTPVVVAQSAPVFAAPACNTCNSPPPAPVCAPVCPPPVQQCTTNYVQRSFYQPVTTMESRSFYEPVTTMQTSFYYEPVTTMQTSFFFDPCSCGVQCKSVPVTSFQLRQKCCPVQSWVQRCAQVPVTTYRQSFYLEPQTTCCNTTAGAPVAAPAPPCNTPGCAPAPSQPSAPAPSYSSPPPPVIDQPKAAPSGPNVGSTSYSPHTVSSSNPGSNWQPVVSLGAPRPEAAIQGQVVRNDRTPKANAEVLFVNASTGARHTITTNDAGRFNLPIEGGNYHVFFATSSGSAAYHSMVNVDRNQPLSIIN